MDLRIPRSGRPLIVPLELGQPLFVVGANGTGKSSLLQNISAQVGDLGLRIPAHRQSGMVSDSVQYAASQLQQLHFNMQQFNQTPASVFTSFDPSALSNMIYHRLIEIENSTARSIVARLREGHDVEARQDAQKLTPVEAINSIFSEANLPLRVRIDDEGRLRACSGNAEYGISRLSDGEKNALLIAGTVLTAAQNLLLIIDEPERHLHRSIMLPLLAGLFRRRSDCFFVVATHDLELPEAFGDSPVLLLRSCEFNESGASSWHADHLSSGDEISEEVRKDILGGRRHLLFVEGRPDSLDAPLYATLFPNISVHPKGSCKDVIQSVKSIAGSRTLHWITARGIVDNDGRSDENVTELQSDGIFCTPSFTVESLYYGTEAIAAVARRQAGTFAGDEEALGKAAVTAGIDAIRDHINRLAARRSEQQVRHEILSKIPDWRQLQASKTVAIQIDSDQIVRYEDDRLRNLVDQRKWDAIAARYPIRETGAREAIASALMMRTYNHYEQAVLSALRETPSFCHALRSSFGGTLARPAERNVAT